MADRPLLTIAFLERLPESSAGVIAGMRPQDAAALFETIPTRIVTPIVEKMEKWPAAQCLQALSPEYAAGILKNVSYQTATVLLRLTPEKNREAIVEHLPSNLAKDLKESLRYPRNCVGAWMDLSVPTLSLNATVKDALAILKSAPRPFGESTFVVDDGQHMAGLVRVETLMRNSAATRLADIMETGLKPLFSRALLREAATDPLWDGFLRLPVAGRNGQLLGTLSRHDMMNGLTTIAARSSAPETTGSIWMQVGNAFIASTAGLVSLLATDAGRSGKNSGP